MRAIAALIVVLFLAGCAAPRPEPSRPCGVITDSLVDVAGKRVSDQQRIDRHYARGEGAGCWK